MECPHLTDFDSIAASSNLKTLSTSTNNGTKESSQEHKPQPRGTRSNKTNTQIQHQCQVCKSDQSPWMCVLCGQIHCGRYVNSHARKHFLNDNQHFLAICCQSHAAFCYACDDYVINETQSKRILRALEQFQNNQTPNKLSKRKDLQVESDLSPSTRANSKAKRIRLAGIRNLGNTCYMNSVLQCLSHIQRFTSSVGDPPGGKAIIDSSSNGSTSHKRKLIQIANDSSKSELLIETLRETIYLLRKSGKSFIIPESLFTIIGKNSRFRGYQQQDAHEFLRYVLDRLDKECLETSKEPDDKPDYCGGFARVRKKQNKDRPSMIGSIFGGVLQNEVNCLKCGFKSHKQDPFLDLSLDIPSSTALQNGTPGKNQQSGDQVSDEQNSQSDVCNLIDCLSSFIELEELTETELYYCSNCQQKQRSTKRFWIKRLPDVLCLHLKRFRYNNFLRTKIDNFIQFPLQGLDMRRFVMTNKHETRGSSCGPTTYDLVAFIEHHGTGVGSGHYTAYCRHDGYWFHFDDSCVTACDESTLKRSKAYILFYNRRPS